MLGKWGMKAMLGALAMSKYEFVYEQVGLYNLGFDVDETQFSRDVIQHLDYYLAGNVCYEEVRKLCKLRKYAARPVLNQDTKHPYDNFYNLVHDKDCERECGSECYVQETAVEIEKCYVPSTPGSLDPSASFIWEKRMELHKDTLNAKVPAPERVHAEMISLERWANPSPSAPQQVKMGATPQQVKMGAAPQQVEMGAVPQRPMKPAALPPTQQMMIETPVVDVAQAQAQAPPQQRMDGGSQRSPSSPPQGENNLKSKSDLQNKVIVLCAATVAYLCYKCINNICTKVWKGKEEKVDKPNALTLETTTTSMIDNTDLPAIVEMTQIIRNTITATPTTTPTTTHTNTTSISTTTEADQRNVQELMVESNANDDNVNSNSVLIPAIGAACGAVALVGVVAGVVYGIKKRNAIANHHEHQAFPEHGIVKLGTNDCSPIFDHSDFTAKENPININ
eukprot:Pgem_evm1s8338